VRRQVLGIAAAGLLLLGGCGGGDSGDETAADEGVRTLEEPTGAEPDAEAEAEPTDAAAEAATEATEAASEDTDEATAAPASGIEGDTDGDGVLSQAELGAYANTLLLEFSACMRENGFADFEDMTVDIFVSSAGNAAQTQGVFFEAMAERGVNLADPAGVEALQGCGGPLGRLQSIAPQPSAEEIAEREASVLDFAACMREQGIDEWPDPDFGANPGGGYGIELTQEIDINSPRIETAGQACQDQGRGFFPEADG
jgi:hypothetical protein